MFHITVAQEIIDLRDAADGARDILSEAPTVSDSFASARPPPCSFLGSGSQGMAKVAVDRHRWTAEEARAQARRQAAAARARTKEAQPGAGQVVGDQRVAHPLQHPSGSTRLTVAVVARRGAIVTTAAGNALELALEQAERRPCS